MKNPECEHAQGNLGDSDVFSLSQCTLVCLS